MKKTLLLLLPVLLVGGCGGDDPTVSPPTLEDLVVANTLAVQNAAEAFAAENNGTYPASTSDASLAGNTLIDLLPGGTPLENPYTGNADQPANGTAARSGETSYRHHEAWDAVQGWTTVGYLITGFGDSTEIISLQKNYPDSILELERQTIANAYTVEAAVQSWALANGGVYPSNVSVDTTPAGDTVADYLPGGILMENPFTLANTEPVNGMAATPGEIGYVPIVSASVRAGYVITGYGARELIIQLVKLP